MDDNSIENGNRDEVAVDADVKTAEVTKSEVDPRSSSFDAVEDEESPETETPPPEQDGGEQAKKEEEEKVEEEEEEDTPQLVPVTDEGTSESKSVDAASRDSMEGDRSLDDTTSDGLNVVVNTTTESGAPSTDSNHAVMSVTPKRKEELLLEARSDRLLWIQNVPLPYAKQQGDQITSFLHYSHVAQHLPAFKSVLEHLYGHATDRFEATLIEQESCNGTTDDDDDNSNKYIYLTGNQILAAEIASTNDDDDDDDDDPDTRAVLEEYQLFLNQLQDPSCAVLVQAMRTFCRNFQDVTDKEEAASRLKAYVTATVETLKQHAAFKKQQEKDEDGPENLQRSLVSFLLGQCRQHIHSLFWTSESAAKEAAFQEKLQALQFVLPTHLDISCFSENNDAVDELLVSPVKALLAVDSYHSVYEKLQQILAVYRGVNAALTAALNKGSDSDSKKLPSADDVLPTIILSVLRAKPVRLLYTLELIDDLSPPQYLRGEAGYAYTNLYGAVQFLQDLDLEKEPSSLSITSAAFREGVNACKIAAEEQLQKRVQQEDASLFADASTKDGFPRVPPPHVIRSARLRGEIVNVDWVLRWQEENGLGDPVLVPDEGALETSENVVEEERLPRGFHRNYSFLTTRPEDVRVADLPQLLEEYRMLVHTTEDLLAERALRAAAERKAKNRKLESNILATARGIDPDLLPTISIGRKSKNG